MEIAHRDPAGWLSHPPEDGLEILRSAFSSSSIFAREFDGLIAGLARQGVHSRLGPSGHHQRSSLVNLTSTSDPNSVGFVWCSYNDSITVRNTDGEIVDADVGFTLGSGQATRIDGRWVLEALTRLSHAKLPPGSPDECPKDQVVGE